jgi:type IV pilus assembly protein PilQ
VPQKLRRGLHLLAAILSLSNLLAAPSGALAQESATPPAATGPVVTSIGVVRGGAGTEVRISGDAPLAYEYFVVEGKSLVIDIPGATSKVWPAEQPIDDDVVGRVRVAEQGGARPGVRVALDLKRAEGFTVRGEGESIAVLFAPAAAGATGSAAPAAEAAGNRVAEVVATRLPGVFRVAVKTDAQPSYRVLDTADARTVAVAIDGARLDPGARASSDYSASNGPVTRVLAASQQAEPPAVVVTVELRQPVPHRIFADASGLNLDFNTDLPRPAAPQAVAGPFEPAAGAAPRPPAAAADAGAGGRAFAGGRITLDFIDADIADIFRLIADVSGMNIVASDDVKGKRSVKMTDVPWDQALDLILKTNIPQLVQIAEGRNVIRITTLQRVLDEQTAVEKRRLEQAQRAAAEQKQALERAELERKFEIENRLQEQARAKAETQRSKGWQERTFGVSYGETKEVAARLEKFFSKCPDGCIFEVGERSNTIFVRDFVDNIAQMSAIFAALETPTPAVMVEARIVEMQSDYSEALGIQWGASFTADAAHGNATDYAFPNSISVGGTAVQGTEGVNPGSYLVNLPAADATSGVGITLGHIANTLSLDLKLSAMEQMGKSKVLSNPKVLVIQNEDANINVGSQLPVPKTDTEGNRTIEWKDVGILLQVRPKVTSDGRVFMKLKIEKSAAGPSVQTTEGEMFSIERRGAETKVLVADGETSVIGGIFQQDDSRTDYGVPGLARLPLVGWLFKSKSVSTGRKELLIFLTPRIVDRATAAETAR